MFILGVDVGGTFTDLVAIHAGSGEIRTTKILSRKNNPASAVADGIAELGLLDDGLGRVVHGTTVATNALVERRGAETALVTTRGFGDTTEIGRGRRLVYGSMFDRHFRRALPLVPRWRRIEVDERLNAQGEALKALDLDELDKVLDTLGDEPVASIAVCFLHSYRNPEHEQAAAKLIRERFGARVFVSVSSEVDPQFRELERFSTTVANAYVGPITGAHIDSLRGQGIEEEGGRKVYIMGSSGGVMDFDTAARFPVRTILSGPAGGMMAARAIGQQLGIPEIITCDMGGTSADVALLKGERLLYAPETIVSGVPIRAAQLDINTVGAGAGSIIWLDVDGALRVGPMSAGSTPGPVCYGGGGTEPTVTDANVVLNRIGDGTLLGGKIRVDGAAAARAFVPVQERLGLASIWEVAEGALQLLVVKTASAIREISLERGFDPREFALVVFGGAGPMHGCFVAEELGMRRVIVPNNPGAFSAFGLILANIRRESVVNYIVRLSQIDLAALGERIAATIRSLTEELRGDNAAEDSIVPSCVLEMRCKGQAHEIMVPVDTTAELTVGTIASAFDRIYAERYGLPPDGHVEREIIALRVVCEGRVEALPPLTGQTGRPEQGGAPAETRDVRFGGLLHPTAIYRRETLTLDASLLGPLIVDESGATTVIPPGWSMSVHPTGALILDRQIPA